jgi:hypothetical protein
MATERTQYTIRGVPPDVDRALRRVAKERNVSLNHLLMQELARIAERAGESPRRHDLDFAIGTMTDGQLVDKALRDFSSVDPDLWK